MSDPLLLVEDLAVDFRTESGVVRAVDGVSFAVEPAEVLAVVGESGCGKSVTAMTLMGLTRGPNVRVTGRVTLGGVELLTADERELQRLRGEQMSMVFQDPMTAMNPVHRVGDQIAEQLRAHRKMSRRAARERAVELLGEAGIPAPEKRARQYPHEFSGGMRQRAMIAMAVSLEPSLLIADEPTTALDVTVQAQILRLIKALNAERGVAVLLITHDLGVVADIADRVMVMYAGRVVETGTRDEVFYDPQHPYTWGLLGSVMRPDRPPTERVAQILGQPPALDLLPPGCHFVPRCPHAFGPCCRRPELQHRGGGEHHLDRCLLEPDDKHRLRLAASGDIGLQAPAA